MKTTVAPKRMMLAAVIALLLAAVVQESASALGPWWPQPNATTTTKEMYMLVSRTAYVRVPTTYVKIYYPATATGTRTITIDHADLCKGASSWDGDNGGSAGDLHTRFRLYRANDYNWSTYTEEANTLVGSTWGRIQNSGAGASCNDRTITFNLGGGGAVSPFLNRKVVILRADLGTGPGRTGTQNLFRVNAPGAIVAGAGGLADNEVGYNLAPPNYTYANFTVPIAPDCSVENTAWRRIGMYDPDNGAAGVQPVPLYYKVYDETAGRWLNQSEYSSPVRSTILGTGPNTRVRPWNVDDTDSSVRVFWRQGHTYFVRIYNLYTNNTIQLRLPFDSIYSDIPCQIWDATATTTMNVNGTDRTNGPTNPYEVSAGATVEWTHRLENEGPMRTDRGISWNVDRIVDSTTTIPLSGTWPAGQSVGNVLTRTTGAYTTTSADEGTRICQRLDIDPGGVNPNGNSTGAESSSTRCIFVTAPWSLSPTTTVSNSAAVPGASITVEGTINKSSVVDAGTHNWRIARLEFAPGSSATPSSVSTGGGDVCARVSGYDSCTIDPANIYSQSFPAAISERSETLNYSIPSGAEFGSQFCFITYVENPTSNASDDSLWRFSSFACVVVGKSPSVHVWGNDLRVGSGWDAADSLTSAVQGRSITHAGLTYGSWGEYSVLAPGTIGLFGSGSGLAAGNVSSAQVGWSPLTFSNTTGFGSFASPAGMGLLPDVESNIMRLVNAGVQLNSGPTIDSWPLSPFTHFIHEQIGGNVQITGNIERPTASYPNVELMPQLIIVADTIEIDADVTRIDAWLVASTSINTCSENLSGPLTATDCSSQLVVNGPIITKELSLRRTAGSNDPTTLNEPAEILNMPADTYIWARHYDEKYGRLKTVSIRELPARY